MAVETIEFFGGPLHGKIEVFKDVGDEIRIQVVVVPTYLHENMSEEQLEEIAAPAEASYTRVKHSSEDTFPVPFEWIGTL